MPIHRSLAAALAGAVLVLAACDSPSDSGRRVPARVDVVSGDLQQAVAGTELAEPLVVRVEDDRGRPVANQPVAFVVTAGGGSVVAGAAVTDREGEARERWTLGTAAGDTQKVEARAVDPSTGRPIVFATFRAVARADAPFAIERASPEEVAGTAGLPVDSLAVRVTDRHGNLVPNAAVVWTVRTGGGSISPPQGATNAAGIAKARWTLGARLDSAQVAEAAAGLSLRAEFRATALPGATRLEKVSGDSQSVAGGGALAQPLVVRVVGPDGQPVAGAVVSWGRIAGTVSPAQSVTDAQGRASTQWTLPAERGTYYAQAYYGTLVQTFWGSTAATQPVGLLTYLPLAGAEVHGEVPAHAWCDRCTRVTAQAGGGPEVTLVADTPQALPVDSRAPGPLTVTLRGYDGVAVAASETRTVTVRAASPVQVVARVPGLVTDYRPDRLLFLDTGAVNRPTLRRLSTGADTVLGGVPTRTSSSVLREDGAVVWVDSTLLQLKDGVQTTLSTSVSSMQVNGSWVVWRSGLRTLIRRNLDAGAQDTVTATDGSAQFAVDSNGDVAFQLFGQSDLVHWRNGTRTPLGRGTEPRADGGVVVFYFSDATRLFQGGTISVLATPGLGGYVVRNGWVAFVRPAASGLRDAYDVWRRSPAGVLEKVVSDCRCSPRSVSGNGEVMFVAGSWLFAWRPGRPPLQLFREPYGAAFGIWLGSETYVRSGHTLFRVTF